MQSNQSRALRHATALGALCALLASGGALAADTGASASAQARYLKERAVCLEGRSNQDRATCLKEAGAALAEAQALAAQIAAFPQQCMRADRASVYAQWDLPLAEALQREGAAGHAAVVAEGLAGAIRSRRRDQDQ